MYVGTCFETFVCALFMQIPTNKDFVQLQCGGTYQQYEVLTQYVPVKTTISVITFYRLLLESA